MSAPATQRDTDHGRARPGRPVRVMVIEDSAMLRGLMARWIREQDGMTLAGSASNGRQALETIAAIRPDIVLLDVEMPELGGLEALPRLLKAWPTAKVLMVSARTKRNTYATFEALTLGAIDYLPKPETTGSEAQQAFRRDLIAKIRLLGRALRYGARSAQKTSLTGEVDERPAGIAAARALRPFSNVVPKVVAIGSSTGGPEALIRFLTPLGPALEEVPVLVTQHMPAAFTPLLAERLGQATGLPTKEGEDGEPVLPGHIYVAPGDRHMVVSGAGRARIGVNDDPPCNFHRPAVDLLFRSVADLYGAASLALILTGMGHDGVAGAAAIAAVGGSVAVQDDRSSVVWGMPGAVQKAGLASAVLAPEALAGLVQELLRGNRP